MGLVGGVCLERVVKWTFGEWTRKLVSGREQGGDVKKKSLCGCGVCREREVWKGLMWSGSGKEEVEERAR